jgi:hypothetical protein
MSTGTLHKERQDMMREGESLQKDPRKKTQVRKRSYAIPLDDYGGLRPGRKKCQQWFFPNWFNKGHFETFMGRKLTDEHFTTICTYFHVQTSGLSDAVSQLMEYWLTDNPTMVEWVNDQLLGREQL